MGEKGSVWPRDVEGGPYVIHRGMIYPAHSVPQSSRLWRIGRAFATGGLSLVFERRKRALGPEEMDQVDSL